MKKIIAASTTFVSIGLALTAFTLSGGAEMANGYGFF